MYRQQKSFSVSSFVWAMVATAIVLLIAASANAQDNITTTSTSSAAEIRTATTASTNTNQNEMKEITVSQRIALMQDQLQIKRAQLETASSTRKGVLNQNTQTLIVNSIGQIATALSGAIARGKGVSAEMRVQAETAQGRGIETGEALRDLDNAEELLRWAEEAVRGMDINAQYAATSDQPMADWVDVKQQFQEVRSLIDQSYTALRNASALLRSLILFSNPQYGTN